jgi:hypothetical protein
VAQVVEHLPSKGEAQSSNPSTEKTNKQTNKQTKYIYISHSSGDVEILPSDWEIVLINEHMETLLENEIFIKGAKGSLQRAYEKYIINRRFMSSTY